MMMTTMMESTSAVFVAEIRESPDVGQINSKADDGQQEVHLLRPDFALYLRHRLAVSRSDAASATSVRRRCAITRSRLTQRLACTSDV